MDAGASGAAVLVGAIGWAGAGLTAAGAGACLIWFLICARRAGGRSRARAVVGSVAAVLAGCAVLARGGPFCPAATLAVALTWGLLPAMAGCAGRDRSAAYVLAAVLAVAAVLGLARHPGLAQWSAEAFGLSKDSLHAPTGFLLAVLLAWLMGSRRFALGVVGVLLAAGAGALGEVLQAAVSARGVQMRDWLLHVLGSAAGFAAYALCIGARACELPIADPRGGDEARSADHAGVRSG